MTVDRDENGHLYISISKRIPMLLPWKEAQWHSAHRTFFTSWGLVWTVLWDTRL